MGRNRGGPAGANGPAGCGLSRIYSGRRPLLPRLGAARGAAAASATWRDGGMAGLGGQLGLQLIREDRHGCCRVARKGDDTAEKNGSSETYRDLTAGAGDHGQRFSLPLPSAGDWRLATGEEGFMGSRPFGSIFHEWSMDECFLYARTREFP